MHHRIDGIDISTIGLEYRARLSLIAQDATLHVGTVRSNLDNFNEFTDADCLDALERVQLNVEEGADEARGRRGVGLDTLVAAGGHNFSAGQRQLLAMARALLKRSNIIIMDEATAFVSTIILLLLILGLMIFFLGRLISIPTPRFRVLFVKSLLIRLCLLLLIDYEQS